MNQKKNENKSMVEAQLDFFNWVNANTFGKVRQIHDAFEYSIGWTGLAASFHAESDAIKNVSSSDLALAISKDNSTTNMLLNYDLIKSGQYEMLSCCKEWKLGTLPGGVTNTVASPNNATQTIAFTGLTASTYYVLYVPTKVASQVTLSGGTTNAIIINNTAIGKVDGLPAGYSGIMFMTQATKTACTFVFTPTVQSVNCVGLATGTNTQLKLYPVSNWAAHECKIWICSEA